MSSPPPPSSSPASPAAPPPSGDSQTPPAPQKPTILDAAKTISPLQDLQKLPSVPCARQALLYGIVAGASVGALRFVFSRVGRRGTLYGADGPWGAIGSAANWAVGAWGVGSLGAWETCRARQTAEAARMQALVADIQKKQKAKAMKRSQLAGGDAVEGGGGPGGILIGEKGRELLREKQAGATGPEGKGEKSWWQGRV
ncbi:hypothetical protein JCM10207_000088 [Rhodosporidiobolus poonsookiae]